MCWGFRAACKIAWNIMHYVLVFISEFASAAECYYIPLINIKVSFINGQGTKKFAIFSYSFYKGAIPCQITEKKSEGQIFQFCPS